MYVPPRNPGTTRPLRLEEATFGVNADQFYGTAIPIGMARRLIVGVPLWVSTVRVTGTGEHIRKTLDLAIGFGQSGVPSDELIFSALLTLWMNDTKVIDRVSTDGPVCAPGINFTLYPGSEDQLPDPLISADLNRLTDKLTIVSGQNAGDGETITINGRVYTFQTVLTNVNGHVKIGADRDKTLDNLVAAITLTASKGNYATATAANQVISASRIASGEMEVKAISENTNLTIAVSDTMAHGSWATSNLTKKTRAPAFRGMVYIVLQNLCLTDFGLDVIPFFRAEIADVTEDLSYVKEFTTLASAVDDQERWCAVDWPRNRLITFREPASGATRWVQVYDISKNRMLTSSKIRLPDGSLLPTGLVIDTGFATVMPDTGLVMVSYDHGTSPHIAYLDPMSGRIVGDRVTSSLNFGFASPLPFTIPKIAPVNGGQSTAVQLSYMSVIGTFSNALKIVFYLVKHNAVDIRGDGGHLVDLNAVQSYPLTFSAASGLRAVLPGETLSPENFGASQHVQGGIGIFYVVDETKAYRVQVPALGYQIADNEISVIGGDYQFNQDRGLIIEEFWEAPADTEVQYAFFDPLSAELVILYSHPGDDTHFVTRVASPNRFLGFARTGAFVTPDNVTITNDPITIYGPQAVPKWEDTERPGWGSSSDISAGSLCYSRVDAETFVYLQTRTGTYQEFDRGNWRFLGETTNQPDAVEPAFIGPWGSVGGYFLTYSGDSGFAWSKVYVGRAPEDKVPLSDILRWYCLLAGLTADQISISGVSAEVWGSILEQRVLLSDLLNDLGAAFQFDWFESEGLLKIVQKGKGGSFAIDLELTRDDLTWVTGDGNSDDRYLVKTKIGTEDAPPTSIEIAYLNIRNNYGVDIATARRTSFPVQTAAEGDIVTIPIPIVLDPSAALIAATKALYATWAGSVTQEFRTAQKHLAMEPSDIVRITLGEFSYVIKLSEVVINGDWSVGAAGVNFGTDDDVSIDADDPIKLPQPVAGSNASQLWWLDTPLLSYTIDPDASLTLLPYSAITSNGQSGWAGGSFWVANPGEAYNELYTNFVDSTVAGIVTNTLADPPGVIIDEVGSLDLSVVIGDPANVATISDDDFLAGGNTAFWGDDGRWEIIRFRDVVDNGDGSLTLSHISRGRRGTEWAAFLHSPGDRFIILDGAVKTTSMSMDLLDFNLNAKAQGVGIDFDAVLEQPIVLSGNSRKCFAPVSLAAAVVGSDIGLSWVRRTKLPTELVDSVDDTPLDAPAELYDIEILDWLGGSVLRLISDVPASTYTYLAADITIDFGSLPASLAFRVYQVDNIVGRGFAAERLVEVVA